MLDSGNYDNIQLEIDGEIDYNSVAEDIDSFLQAVSAKGAIELGIVGPDNQLNIEQMYAGVQDVIQASSRGEISIPVDYDLTSFDDVVSALEDEELTIQVNPETGDWEWTDVETGEIIWTTNADEVAAEIETFRNMEDTETRHSINIEVNGESDWGMNSSDFIQNKLFGQGSELEATLLAKLNIEGEVNKDTLNAAMEGVLSITDEQREIIHDVLVKINPDIDKESINFDDVTMFLSEQLNKEEGAWTTDEAIQYLIDMVMQPGEIDKSELEETKDLVKPEDIPQDNIEKDIDVDPNFEAKAGNSDELESQFTAGIGSLEAEVPIDIALSENIIQDNLDGITSILSDDYGIEVGIDVQSDGIEPVMNALSELPEEEQILILAKAMGIEDLDNISNAIEGIPSEKIVSAILQATGTDTLEAGIAALENFDGTVATAEATTIKNTEGEEPEPPTDAEATHTTYIEFAVTNPEAVAALDGQDISFTVTANINDNASAGIQSINSALESMPLTQSVSVTASTFGAMSQIALVKASLTMLGMMVVTPKINGDNSEFFTAAGEVSGWVPPSFTVRIGANTQPFRSAVSGLSALVPASLSTTINAKVSRSGSATIG